MSVKDFENWCREAYDEIEAGIRAESASNMEEVRFKYDLSVLFSMILLTLEF